MKLDNYECEGQMSIFEVADKPLKFHEAEWLKGHGFKNVYDEPPKAGIYEFTDIEYPTKVKKFEVAESGAIKIGSSDFVARWWRPLAEDKVCSFSGHTCNKKNLWEIADTLDNIECPRVCCRKCDVKMCGARCNGSEEPRPLTPAEEYYQDTGKTTYWQDSQGKPYQWWKQDTTDDYIKENPTCFYVFGHYLDREEGWHKVPEELPTFTKWSLIDVVIFGRKSGTTWMEHGEWEAKDWTFRSIEDKRKTETFEILAWKLSD